MYLLTIRDGLQTRHIGPYESPARAVEELDALLGPSGGRARWQIHELEAPLQTGQPRPERTGAEQCGSDGGRTLERPERTSAVAA